jgi:hypothetical protein
LCQSLSSLPALSPHPYHCKPLANLIPLDSTHFPSGPGHRHRPCQSVLGVSCPTTSCPTTWLRVRPSTSVVELPTSDCHNSSVFSPPVVCYRSRLTEGTRHRGPVLVGTCTLRSVVSVGIRRVTPRHVDRHRHTHDERHRRDTSRWVTRYNPSLHSFMTIGRLTLTLVETTRPSRHLFSVFYDYPSAEIRTRRFNPFFTSSIFRIFDSPRLTHIHPWSFRLRVSWGVPRLRHTCLVILKG